MHGVLFERTPVLSLAPNSLASLGDLDANSLSDLWGVFTKCKDTLQNGRRLENLSWRLWFDSGRKEARQHEAATAGVNGKRRSVPGVSQAGWSDPEWTEATSDSNSDDYESEEDDDVAVEEEGSALKQDAVAATAADPVLPNLHARPSTRTGRSDLFRSASTATATAAGNDDEGSKPVRPSLRPRGASGGPFDRRSSATLTGGSLQRMITGLTTLPAITASNKARSLVEVPIPSQLLPPASLGHRGSSAPDAIVAPPAPVSPPLLSTSTASTSATTSATTVIAKAHSPSNKTTTRSPIFQHQRPLPPSSTAARTPSPLHAPALAPVASTSRLSTSSSSRKAAPCSPRVNKQEASVTDRRPQPGTVAPPPTPAPPPPMRLGSPPPSAMKSGRPTAGKKIFFISSPTSETDDESPPQHHSSSRRVMPKAPSSSPASLPRAATVIAATPSSAGKPRIAASPQQPKVAQVVQDDDEEGEWDDEEEEDDEDSDDESSSGWGSEYSTESDDAAPVKEAPLFQKRPSSTNMSELKPRGPGLLSQLFHPSMMEDDDRRHSTADMRTMVSPPQLNTSRSAGMLTDRHRSRSYLGGAPAGTEMESSSDEDNDGFVDEDPSPDTRRQSTQAIPAAAAALARRERERLEASIAPPQSPRTTRRAMLATELSESLRRNLLWERQTRNRVIGGPVNPRFQSVNAPPPPPTAAQTHGAVPPTTRAAAFPPMQPLAGVDGGLRAPHPSPATRNSSPVNPLVRRHTTGTGLYLAAETGRLASPDVSESESDSEDDEVEVTRPAGNAYAFNHGGFNAHGW